MKPAYDISYRDEITETQGRLFGRLAREYPECDGADFITAYMKGDRRARIDRAEALSANMTASELKDRFLCEEGYVPRSGEPIDALSADWIGQFYSYYQWASGMESREIVNRLPVSVMSAAYSGLHDLALPLAVERISRLECV